MQIRIQPESIAITRELREFTLQRLRFVLGRYRGKVRSAAVRWTGNETSGSECTVVLVMGQGPRIVVAERDRCPRAAAGRATERAGRAVARQIEMKQPPSMTKPLVVHFGD